MYLKWWSFFARSSFLVLLRRRLMRAMGSPTRRSSSSKMQNCAAPAGLALGQNDLRHAMISTTARSWWKCAAGH